MRLCGLSSEEIEAVRSAVEVLAAEHDNGHDDEELRRKLARVAFRIADSLDRLDATTLTQRMRSEIELIDSVLPGVDRPRC